MAIVLITLAIFVALFEIARSQIDAAEAPTPELRKIDDEDERRRR